MPLKHESNSLAQVQPQFLWLLVPTTNFMPVGPKNRNFRFSKKVQAVSRLVIVMQSLEEVPETITRKKKVCDLLRGEVF